MYIQALDYPSILAAKSIYTTIPMNLVKFRRIDAISDVLMRFPTDRFDFQRIDSISNELIRFPTNWFNKRVTHWFIYKTRGERGVHRRLSKAARAGRTKEASPHRQEVEAEPETWSSKSLPEFLPALLSPGLRNLESGKKSPNIEE